MMMLLYSGVPPGIVHKKTAVGYTAARPGGSLARYGIIFFMVR